MHLDVRLGRDEGEDQGEDGCVSDHAAEIGVWESYSLRVSVDGWTMYCSLLALHRHHAHQSLEILPEPGYQHACLVP